MVDTEAIKEKERKKKEKRLFTRYFGDQIASDIPFQNSMIKFIFIKRPYITFLVLSYRKRKLKRNEQNRMKENIFLPRHREGRRISG